MNYSINVLSPMMGNSETLFLEAHEKWQVPGRRWIKAKQAVPLLLMELKCHVDILFQRHGLQGAVAINASTTGPTADALTRSRIGDIIIICSRWSGKASRWTEDPLCSRLSQ